MQTYIVYILTLMLVLAFANQAHLTSRIEYVYLIVFILSFIEGFRDFSVGIDTESYIKIFNYIENEMFELAYGELGFKYLTYYLLKVTGSYSAVFFIYACIINGLITLRLWDYKNIASFQWMIGCYYISFYFMSMNIMRQFIAVAIVFFATRYIGKKKYMLFLIMIVVATLLHTSSLIGVCFIGMELFQWRHLNKKQKSFFGMAVLISPLVMIYSLKVIMRYGHYFDTFENNLGYMLFFKLIIFLVSIMTFCKKNYNNGVTQDLYDYTTKAIKLYYLLGILITGLGYFFLYMDRIGLPFYLFECVYFGIIIKNTMCNRIFKIIISMLLCYMFILDLCINSQGQLPYLFIWQGGVVNR